MRLKLMAVAVACAATTVVACGDDAGFVGASGLYRADTGHAGLIVQTCGHPLAEIRLSETMNEEFSTTEDRTIARLVAKQPMSGLIEINLGYIDDTLFDVEGDPLAVDYGDVSVVYHPRTADDGTTIPPSSATSADIANLSPGEYINRPADTGDDYPIARHGRAYFENFCES